MIVEFLVPGVDMTSGWVSRPVFRLSTVATDWERVERVARVLRVEREETVDFGVPACCLAVAFFLLELAVDGAGD